MLGGATQAMPLCIVEERQQRRRPLAAAPLRAAARHGELRQQQRAGPAEERATSPILSVAVLRSKSQEKAQPDGSLPLPD